MKTFWHYVSQVDKLCSLFNGWEEKLTSASSASSSSGGIGSGITRYTFERNDVWKAIWAKACLARCGVDIPTKPGACHSSSSSSAAAATAAGGALKAKALPLIKTEIKTEVKTEKGSKRKQKKQTSTSAIAGASDARGASLKSEIKSEIKAEGDVGVVKAEVAEAEDGTKRKRQKSKKYEDYEE